MTPARNHLSWWAFIVHRVSGIALALFLPAHFLALGSALRGEAALDEFLHWSEQPLVVAGEWVLVILLSAHLAGGLRLLALEFLPWQNWQKTLATLAAAFALVAGLVFALSR
jgi:succinate dehydrogenase subunit D